MHHFDNTPFKGRGKLPGDFTEYDSHVGNLGYWADFSTLHKLCGSDDTEAIKIRDEKRLQWEMHQEGKEGGIKGIKKGKRQELHKNKWVLYCKIKRERWSWPTLRFDAGKWPQILYRLSFWFPLCSHLPTALKAIFKQKETDKNKKLFPRLRNKMTETRGNRRGLKRFSPHFSLSCLLLFELPPALALSAPAELSTAPTGHLSKSSQDELTSQWWVGAVQAPAPVPTLRSPKVENGHARITWHCHFYAKKGHFCVMTYCEK